MIFKKIRTLAAMLMGVGVLALASTNVQALSLQCALPYTNAKPGKDCNGKHFVRINVTGGSPSTVLSAEALALNTDGTILKSQPIQAGKQVQLNSRIAPTDYRFQTVKNVLRISAPIPLISVTATDGDDVVHAYCSNVPYLRVYQPTGQVANADDTIDVMMAATGLNPDTLQVLVDGVDILSALGIDPVADLPGTFPGGVVVIGGENVTISDLVVDVAGVQQFASNTVSFSLDGLAAGGHIIYVDGERAANAPAPDPIDPQCYVDDMEDVGQFSIFGVNITSPTDQEVVNTVPTPVQGLVAHGRPIAGVKINGAPLDLSSMSFVAGNGTTTADQYEYVIDELVPQTNLRQDLDTQDTPLGTFDRGSNRLTADALDGDGNRAFDELFFAVGSVQSPNVAPSVLEAAVASEIESDAAPLITAALAEAQATIENSFVVGLTPEAVQTLIDQKCPDAGQQFKSSVETKILVIPPIIKKFPGGCSCDPNVSVGPTGVVIDENDISCQVTFVDDQINVAINLPDVKILGKATGHCRSEEELTGICLAETTVDISSTTTISNLGFSFSITEGQFLGAPPSTPTFVTGTSLVATTGGAEVDCLASVCNWAIEGIVTIFSFGTADLDLTPSLDISQVTEFNEAVGASEPDPIDLGEIKVDDAKVEEFGQASLGGGLESVEITPQGLLATLGGNFETLAIDPEVAQTPGAVVEVAPAPVMKIGGASDATVLLSDDAINQLFASMSQSGGLKTSCQDTGKVVNDVLPADCDSLTGALASGYCHGVRGEANCEAIFQGTLDGDAVKQGVCHGARGDTCSTLVGLALERSTCSATPPVGFTGTDPVLACSQQDNPPRFLLQDDPGTPDKLETAIRLTDLSVSIVVDRGAGGSAGDGTADLPNTPKCFGSEETVNGDCSLYSTCLDLNLETSNAIASSGAATQECPPGVPGFATTVESFQALTRQAGVVCGAPQETADDELVSTSNQDQTVDLIRDNAAQYAPPLCIKGLDLGGFVTVQNPKIIAVETDGNLDFQEYIGITGGVAAP